MSDKQILEEYKEDYEEYLRLVEENNKRQGLSFNDEDKENATKFFISMKRIGR